METFLDTRFVLDKFMQDSIACSKRRIEILKQDNTKKRISVNSFSMHARAEYSLLAFYSIYEQVSQIAINPQSIQGG